eukprot:s1892_g2.t1
MMPLTAFCVVAGLSLSAGICEASQAECHANDQLQFPDRNAMIQPLSVNCVDAGSESVVVMQLLKGIREMKADVDLVALE